MRVNLFEEGSQENSKSIGYDPGCYNGSLDDDQMCITGELKEKIESFLSKYPDNPMKNKAGRLLIHYVISKANL